jgi:hypothetical protein
MGKKVWGYQNFSKKAVTPMKDNPSGACFLQKYQPSSKNV